MSKAQKINTPLEKRKELADFLRTRREKLKPESMGLEKPSRRRTPGLRREEVAELAGVGTAWYTWLEQAREIQPSSEVLKKLSQALRLDPFETKHLYTLAGRAVPDDLLPSLEKVTPSLQRFIESLPGPVFVLGERWDILGFNKPADTTFRAFKKTPERWRNWLYMMFCVPESRGYVKEWEKHARGLLAEFRGSLGDSLANPWVQELLEELKKQSPEFALWWKDHNVSERGATDVEIDHTHDHAKFERVVFYPAENPKLRLLVFNPI
jgi:transcriptional regulator with XRE-family HTH domain